MMFKNTIKLTFANFINTWKIMLYKIIVFFCVLGLTFTICWPIIDSLIIEDFFVLAQSQYDALFFNGNIVALFNTTASLIKQMMDIIVAHNQVWLLIVSIVTSTVLYYFTTGLEDLSVTNIISGYMSNSTKYGFLNTFVANLRKSSCLQLARTITVLPINILLIVSAYYIFVGLTSVSGILATMVTMLFVIVTFSLKGTLFSGWVPAIQVKNLKTWQGLRMGVKAMSRRFYRTLSTNIVLITCIIVLNLFALLFTCGIGLFITLPLSTLVMLIFNTTMYYGSNGIRYYVDSQTIISPKKLELQDTIKKVKNII